MGENTRTQILAQEVIRRLGNTKEDMGNEIVEDILDKFSQKLINSGHNEEQTRRIIIAGIKGWEGRRKRCAAEGRRIRRTAKESKEARMRTKLVGKTTWFRKGGKKTDWYGRNKGGHGNNNNRKRVGRTSTTPPRSVLFVEQTPGGN